MTITTELIRATARTYSAEQLRKLIAAAVQQLEQGDVITSANTGGAGYTRQQRITPQEQIELWESALAYHEGRELDSAAQVYPVIHRRPY